MAEAAAVAVAAAGETHSVVHRQLRDIVLVQQRKIRSFGEMIRHREEESVSREEFEDVEKELENERLEHVKTKALLSKESEKLQFALGEIEILMKQLEREKKAFENAFVSLSPESTSPPPHKDIGPGPVDVQLVQLLQVPPPPEIVPMPQESKALPPAPSFQPRIHLW
uniref:spermatogenesis-associated protein 24-like isoform X2 n=1 Tax=Pristiophorus japonicus TaxID=55135 RepID=UPI00398F0E95